MDLSNFVTYNKQESLLLSIAKSNQEIVENTHSKPQETLEFKMNKQKESFSFDIPMELPEQWMMGVTSLEVYNTVYNITEKNNKLQIILNDQQLKSLNVDTQLVMNVECLCKISDMQSTSGIGKVNNFIVDSYSKNKKLTKKDFDKLKKIINQIIQNIKDKTTIIIPEFGIENDFIEIELTPGVCELVDINRIIKHTLSDSDYEFECNIEADTISMKSVLTTSNPIYFNSKLNALLGFTMEYYIQGTHISEKPVMITTTDKVHLKCDCVDGSIVNGVREQILFSFNLSAPPGYKIIKEPNIILYKKINKTRLDSIQFFLEDSNHNPVDFNGETLTFTIQIIKI